ncbi:MAG: hypothetical protein LBK53_09320 [Heliobacteriaceae bacterium]|jgi:hypothetical protein|nr:hypothetical protein [Heliobacteriaceae bacterium]
MALSKNIRVNELEQTNQVTIDNQLMTLTDVLNNTCKRVNVGDLLASIVSGNTDNTLKQDGNGKLSVDNVFGLGTGWKDIPTVNYDSAARTITLSGTVSAYFNGKLVEALLSGWQSPPHDDTYGTWYLSYDPIANTPIWSQNVFNFDHVLIAIVQYYENYKFAQYETHGGNMPASVHIELHEKIGAYLQSGGDLQSYTLNNTADKRPDVGDTYIADEDLVTKNIALATKEYTQFYIDGSNPVYITGQTDIVPVSKTYTVTADITGTMSGYAVDDMLTYTDAVSGVVFNITVTAVDGSGAITEYDFTPETVTQSIDLSSVELDGGSGAGALLTISTTLSAQVPYYNNNSAQTLMDDGKYQTLFLIGIPAASDDNSQNYRFAFIQGQLQSDTLEDALNVMPLSINLHQNFEELHEYVIFKQIVIQYTGGDWVISNVANIEENKYSTSQAGGNTGLTIVSTDNTLKGNGTAANPLGVVNTEPLLSYRPFDHILEGDEANGWTAQGEAIDKENCKQALDIIEYDFNRATLDPDVTFILSNINNVLVTTTIPLYRVPNGRLIATPDYFNLVDDLFDQTGIAWIYKYDPDTNTDNPVVQLPRNARFISYTDNIDLCK